MRNRLQNWYLLEKPTEYPSLTICNANPFTTSTAQSLIQNITISNYGKDINNFTSQEVLTNFSDVNDMARMLAGQKSYKSGNKMK